jgi:hypothetical protein
MKVTFDTNVWRRLFPGEQEFHLKWLAYAPYIRDKIVSGVIQPYICEIAISLESIKREKRLQFFGSYGPKIEIKELPSNGATIHSKFTLGPNNEAHPGLPPELKKDLNLANSLGFKVLRMTNLGTVRSNEIPSEMLINFENRESFWCYAEKLAKCSDFIRALGVGASEYHKLKNEFGIESDSPFTILEKVEASQKEIFIKAVAEWVDGDSLSAHFAYGNDFFCTEDQAKNARDRSVFYNSNIIKVKEKFGLNILSVEELSKL